MPATMLESKRDVTMVREDAIGIIVILEPIKRPPTITVRSWEIANSIAGIIEKVSRMDMKTVTEGIDCRG
jgi:hypothetical protein